MTLILYLCIYRGIHWLLENPEQSLVLTLTYICGHKLCNCTHQLERNIEFTHIHFSVLKSQEGSSRLCDCWNYIIEFYLISPILASFEFRFGFIHVFENSSCTMRSLNAKRILVCLGQRHGNPSSWFLQTLAYNNWPGLPMPMGRGCQQRVCK